MKELDDENAQLLRSLGERQKAWRSEPGVMVWAFWIGEDSRRAHGWAKENEIQNIVFGVVSPKDKKLHAWNINPMATNTLVLADRRKSTVVSFTDVEAEEIETLKEGIAEAMESRK